ncbi:hypothetical protein [Halomicrobium sp. IBSBa]|uniref:hypothetical protein n=1 Tax=Halomicrobium sp. IBSBa TaxID=2778916 RepID=UPI001ABF24DE|nr:hypothetical protein [Halomicrobium sp. IBSBa]
MGPVTTLLIVKQFDLRSWTVALGLLGAVSTLLASLTIVLVHRRIRLLARLNAGWLPWMLPLAGFVPVFVYYFDVIELSFYLYVGAEGGIAATVLGGVGFALGVVACWLGELILRTARNQVASLSVSDGDITVEWTAAWPLAHKLKTQIGVVILCVMAVGPIAIWYSPQTIVYAAPGVVTIVLVTNSLLSDRTYRVNSSGLEHRRTGRLFDYRQFIPWSQFRDYSVKDGSIILHRRSAYPSLRFSRRDIRSNEDDIVDALEEHIPRHNL